MKKVLFSVLIAMCCVAVFTGCIKHPVHTLTINPTMTAVIDADTFTAVTVVPSVVTNQVDDTATVLTITGNANLLQSTPGNQIILTLPKYKGLTGTFSLIQGQAVETYIHNGITSVGTGGIISISNITSNTIIGYFSFTTADGHTISNGSFVAPKP